MTSIDDQLRAAGARPGSALERLIRKNQDIGLLQGDDPQLTGSLPVWLRVLWRRQHPGWTVTPGDPTGGYPRALRNLQAWLLLHPELEPGEPASEPVPTSPQWQGPDFRIYGAPSQPFSESDIRINFWHPNRVIAAANNISGGHQAQFHSTNGGLTWGKTVLPLTGGDVFQSDPTVEWTSNGKAWTVTLGIDGSNNLRVKSFVSTNGGVSWSLDGTGSGSQVAADKELIWVDHSSSSPYKDNLYAIWHNNAPAFVNRRTASGWGTPLQVSDAQSIGTAIGGDITTNADGDVFAFWPTTGNGTAGTAKIFVAKSTNGAASFGTPVAIASTYDSYDIGVPAMNTRRALIYVSGGCFKAGSKNLVYASWTDLSGAAGCTSPANEPGGNTSSSCTTKIWFSRSTDGGATWSAPVIITNTPGADQFNQRLVVDEYTGELGLIYYSTAGAGSRLATQVWFQRSNDNGLTWSPAVQLTISPTNETVAGADLGNQYGDYNGLSGYKGVFLPSWTDRRSGGAEEIWTALMHTQPVLHLSFDDPTDVGIDDSGNGHDGTLAAATVIQGQCGNALHFLPNNNVQEFSVPHNSALDMVGPMTGIAWVSVEGQQSTDNNPTCTEGTIFAKEGANWFQVEKNNDALVFQNEGSGNPGTVASEPTTVPLNSWTQVAFVREADGHTVQFYQDGAPLGSPHIIPTFAFTNPSPLMIGNYGFQNDPGACEFNGGLDEIKIYDVALPASSILSEYAEVLGCVEPGKHSKPGNGPCAGDPNCPEPILYTPRTGLSGPRDLGTDNEPLTLRAEPALLRAQTRFRLSRSAVARGAITIHDIAGRTVQTLEIPATTSSVWWDGRNTSGRRVRPGVYLARIEVGGAVAQARVIVVQ